MNKLQLLLKECALTVMLFSFCATHANAQQLSQPKNFAGISGSVLWNTTSIATGLAGERMLMSKENKELSVQASYTLRHRFGNLVLLFSTPYDISSTELSLGTNGYWFTGTPKNNTGFFLMAGAGALHSNWKYSNGAEAGKTAKNYLRLYSEAGFGWKWKLGENMALRWSNTIKLGTPQPEAGGAVITVSTLSLGF